MAMGLGICARARIRDGVCEARPGCRAHVHVDFDSDRRVVTAICTIDNLLKGASAQAIQALNVALGYDETTGLPTLPLMI